MTYDSGQVTLVVCPSPQPQTLKQVLGKVADNVARLVMVRADGSYEFTEAAATGLNQVAPQKCCITLSLTHSLSLPHNCFTSLYFCLSDDYFLRRILRIY